MAQSSLASPVASQLSSVELVQSLFSAFGRGDTAYIVNQVTVDCRWLFPAPGILPVGGEYQGPAGVSRFFQVLSDSENITKFEPREYFPKGDDVVVLGQEEMRSKKTGQSACTHWSMVFRVKDGKVYEWEIYLDTAAYAKAHGAL